MANHKPDLRADHIADALGGAYPAIPRGYVSFKGYLAAEHEGVHRLYLNDTFRAWLEIQTGDIAFRLDVPTNEKDSRSVVWIEREAQVVECHVGKAYELEDEVWGVDPGGGPNKPKPPY